ncbi:MAG: family 20 glycosylhydrolase [Limnochordia bacterium]
MSVFTRMEPVIGIRCLHLDLKGQPPTPQRLLSLLELLAKARYNAVLVEWEDMFPWTCDERFRCETAYKPEEVKAFVAKAKELGIDIIPLVQCLGHLETPLKFPEYAHLREVPDRPDVLNPLAEGARDLVMRMVDDVLALMPDIKYLHLGGDEAWTFGTHPDTKAYIEAHGKGALYMHHVEPILDHLSAQGIRPILWHDMMTHWDDASLDHLKGKADLCVWGYQGSPKTVASTRHFHISHIQRFAEHGVSLWGGTAYKGADGLDAEVPNPEIRAFNIKAWTDTATEYNMKGVVATAWSRYNTMVTQCEPIDASLDMLVLAGLVMYNGEQPENVQDAIATVLQEAGELERFRACYEPVAELGRLKKIAWDQVRLARIADACFKLDPDRADPPAMQRRISDLNRLVERMEEQAKRIEESFTGLVPDIWIKRFCGDRIESLRGEIEDLAARI